MPVYKKRDVAIRSAGRGRSRSLPSKVRAGREAATLRIALVNNMPDAALKDTEAQFVGLLRAAAKDIRVEVALFSLPAIPRGEQARIYLAGNYLSVEKLLADRFDGVIVTGTEPHYPDLRSEPYWNELAQVMDWAEEHSSSTVLSCLSAHAAVFHSDGVLRQRMKDKRFGVFAEAKVADHALVRALRGKIWFPHSRWNDLRATDLTARGYTVLTKSEEAGVGLFIKEKKNSLFVHFQGHPEYGACTLMKEYRRDVRRFLRKERETYPSLPQGYFDARVTHLLNEFRAEAEKLRVEEILEKFPEALVAETLQNTWRSTSVSIYRHWLEYLSCKKKQAGRLPVHSSMPLADERN
jgi:homoserine O-succinyltransferase/O-acetyltransferase